jgi:methylenetetrahydrofolate--tRNA-(uracil-5-)-methyltransferase
MRPGNTTEAHETGEPAELVCSNSLKSDEPGNAHGLLKSELRRLGSELLACAELARVPGGKALVVDRRSFSAEVARRLVAAGVDIEQREVEEIPDGIAVIASGPLTSTPLAEALGRVLGAGRLFFYDAIAPIVLGESLDHDRIFAASRYGFGDDYLNCPLDEAGYDRLVEELKTAELHPLHDFESAGFFEGCLPVEEMARRGRMVLAFGPMKPVGLADPRTGRRPFAVVQLRRENASGTMYNLVGFQTRLKHGEQLRVFRLIPGLERAEFARLGSIHRNTYIDGPKTLLATLQTRVRADLFVAGQLTGVEGYVESIAAGLVAGMNAARLARGQEPLALPAETMSGALLQYVSSPNEGFQPMNANFGLLPVIAGRMRGRERKTAQAERALAALEPLARQLAGDD